VEETVRKIVDEIRIGKDRELKVERK